MTIKVSVTIEEDREGIDVVVHTIDEEGSQVDVEHLYGGETGIYYIHQNQHLEVREIEG